LAKTLIGENGNSCSSVDPCPRSDRRHIAHTTINTDKVTDITLILLKILSH